MPLAALFTAAVLLASPDSRAEREVTVTVTDESGAAVEGLSLLEVAVLENGVARPVTELRPESEPLTVAVLVDSSQPMAAAYRSHLVEPVVQFLTRLPADTRFAVWITGDRPQKVAEGEDAAAAARALRRVIPQGGNVLFDALVEAARELGPHEGRRAMIVVVTGMGPGFANYDRQRVVDAVLEADATVLAVQVDEGRVPPSRPPVGEVSGFEYEFVLGEATKRSGGRRESVLSPMGVDTALEKLASEVRGRYRVRYEPLAGMKPGDARKIEVTVARPGAKARVAPVEE